MKTQKKTSATNLLGVLQPFHELRVFFGGGWVSACSGGMGFPRFIALRCVTATNAVAHSAGCTPGTRRPRGGPWPRGRSRRVPVMLGIEVQRLPTKVMDMDVICQGGGERKNSRHWKGEKSAEILSQNWRLRGCPCSVENDPKWKDTVLDEHLKRIRIDDDLPENLCF